MEEAAGWSWVVIGALSVLAAWLGWLWLGRRRGLPGPWGVPLLGYLPFLNPAQLHKELTDLARHYGPMYQLQLGQKQVVVLCDRALIQEALALPQLSGRPDSGLTSILAKGGHSSLSFRSADEPGWELSRSIAVHAAKLVETSRGSRMEADVGHALDQLDRIVRSQGARPINSRLLLHPVVESVASSLCFGRPAKLGDPLLRHIATEFDGILKDQSRIELLTFLPALEWFYRKDVAKCLAKVRGLARTVHANLAKRPAHPPVEGSAGVRNLSQAVFVAASQRTSNGLLQSSQMLELDLYDGASHMLSENLQWLLLLVASHPRVQARLQRVLDIGVPGERRASLADLPFLAYLEAVVWEGLRWASNLPFAIPHTATADVADFHGARIPKGALLLPNLYAVNHDPRHFPQPHAFLPERFLAQGGGVDYALVGQALPFSAGRRSCVGEKLGRAYLLLLFANILRDWEVRLPKGALSSELLEPIASFSLFPKAHELVFARRRRPRLSHYSH